MKTIITLLITIVFTNATFGQTRKDSLIVIVGKKIELKFDPEENRSTFRKITGDKDTTHIERVAFSRDHRYVAKYQILDLVHGTYMGDTIDFIAYDHYGEPEFSKYQEVLLFISNHNGKLYHEKHQYFALYKTVSGAWASPYSSADYAHGFYDGQSVRPEIINFKDHLSFPVKDLKAKQRKRWYPRPYYKIREGYAIPVYGNYVKDLFTLKQLTVLKARGIY